MNQGIQFMDAHLQSFLYVITDKIYIGCLIGCYGTLTSLIKKVTVWGILYVALPYQSTTGLPNVRPRGRMRPPGLFYAAPGPFSKNRAGRENYYRYLLIVHFHISIADFLFCSFEQPVC